MALTVGAESPEVPAAIIAVADSSAAVRTVYAPDGRPRTWLIRPDGYVAACTEPTAEHVLAAWLTGTGAAGPDSTPPVV